MAEGGFDRTLPAFRHEAPNLGPGVIARPRLAEVLAGRFRRRLTVITAGAGFGKSTALSQAAMANAANPDGLDVWLRLTPSDREPEHLLAGLVRSMVGPGGDRTTVTVDDVVELVWSRAPTQVALVLDDVHVLNGSDAAWPVLEELLSGLPTNSGLVLAGRTPPRLPVSRMLASGDAAVLDERTMAFTEDERAEFGRLRNLDAALVAALPPWPAVAELATAVGHPDRTRFLWREVLSGIEPVRLELLARAALFDVVDDVIVGALAPDPSWTATRLVDGLPLVDHDRLGSHRMHALWADAFDGLLTNSARRRALVAGADALLEHRQFLRAAAAYRDADDRNGVHRSIRMFAMQPIAAVTLTDVVALTELLPDELREAPIGRYLDAARQWSGDQHEAAARFAQTVQCAIETADAEVESLARWRLVQLQYLDDHGLLQVDPRLTELVAAGVPLAASCEAFIRSVQAQNEGRVDDALAVLDRLDGFDPGQRQAATMLRLIDLGRPEAISATLDSVLGPDGVDLFGAQAIWMRGEVDPETGWAIASQLPGMAGRSGVVNEQVTLRCVIANIALAAGAIDAARGLVDQAREWFDRGGGQVREVVLVAEALLALHDEGDDAARARFAAALDLVPLGNWPARGHLHGLAAIRALAPSADVLDRVELGPSLQVAVDAGRSVTELRAGDITAGRDLPWDSPNLLRCQVPAPLLGELAVAVSTSTDPVGERARAVLETLPLRRLWLGRITERGDAVLAAAAASMLAELPERPAYELRVHALGPLRIERTDGVEIEPAWERRARVRQILGRLIVERAVGRAELIASLWPELPAAKASANLRTNVRHLHRVLEPDRDADAPAWFVRADDATLELSPDGIHLDVDRFDSLVAAALEAESRGAPSVALAEYHAAAELYRGDLLAGVDDPVVELERLRLRSVAHGVACRRGELILAHGDAERAVRCGDEALHLDPLSERAHRLVIRAHLALGSISAAHSAVTRLRTELARVGLEPDDETRSLLGRIDAG